MDYVFFDTEGTGTHPRFDRPHQFAGLRTNAQFGEIDTLNVVGRLPSYIVPHPQALSVTQTDPYELESRVLSATDFAKTVHRYMSRRKQTTFVGHNILSYDEEVLRTTFWMQLLSPYITTRRGCARIDTLPLMRLIHTLDPSALSVSTTEKGNPSFKLDVIAPMNGFADHQAHDALGDVRATAYLFHLLQARRPDLFQLALHQCSQHWAQEILDQGGEAHLLTYFGQPAWHHVRGLCAHPDRPKTLMAFDLSQDPTPWLDLSPEEIVEAMRVPGGPLRRIHSHKQPGIVPLGTTGVPVVEVAAHRALLASRPDFAARVAASMVLRDASFTQGTQLEEKIYGGFPSRQDERRMEQFHDAGTWAQRASMISGFEKKELRQIALLMVLDAAPEVLEPSLRDACLAGIRNNRLLAGGESAWTTLVGAEAALADLPESPVRASITRWTQERLAKLLGDAPCG